MKIYYEAIYNFSPMSAILIF